MSHISRFGANRTEFRQNRPLTDAEMRLYAPSIFAASAHDSRSARYTYIPTSTVLDGLRGEGFMPFMVAQSRSRIAGKSEFTKHMIRFRREANGEFVPETPELILVNSHDGTSSYQLIYGMIRFACANGLVCGDIVSDVKVAHKGDIVREVIEGAYTVIGQSARVTEDVANMKAIALTPDEGRVFARAALTARFGTDLERTDAETGIVDAIPVTVDQALAVRRSADHSNDLWTTFNRVQEATVRGGLRHAQVTEAGRRGRTRAVTGISQNVALNRALWQLADEMAHLKNGGTSRAVA